jgi:hypothetical protein
LSSEIPFFFLVNFLFTADEIHFQVWDSPIAVAPLPKPDKDAEQGETDIRAGEGKWGSVRFRLIYL